MSPKETKRERRAQVARELGSMLRRQARRKWDGVRTARRNEQGHQVWRFQPSPGASERFLHVSFEAMEQGENSSQLLFAQLKAGRWLDRLDKGGETALRLTRGGEIESYPATH